MADGVYRPPEPIGLPAGISSPSDAIVVRSNVSTIPKTMSVANRVLTPMIDPRPIVEAPDDDPYLWLEEIDGKGALAWVDAQNAATLARFGDRRFEADRNTLAEIYDRPDNIP